MNGWERLGIVTSLIIGVPLAFGLYEGASKSYGYVYPTDEQLSGLSNQQKFNKVWQIAQASDPERYRHCVIRTVRIKAPSSTYSTSWDISCTNAEWVAFREAIKGLVLPFFAIFLMGWVVAWIRDGFRKPK